MGLRVLEKIFLKFSHYKTIETIDAPGGNSLDPRGIYVGDHLTLQHTKYISCGPHGFGEDF